MNATPLKMTLFLLAASFALPAAAQTQSPYQRFVAQQQQQQAERLRQQEAARRELRELQIQRELRFRQIAMEQERQRRRSEEFIRQLNEKKEIAEQEKAEQREQDQREAFKLNEENRRVVPPPRFEREPQVVQRRLIRTEQRRTHGGPEATYTVRIYRVVYDNGTSDEVEE